MGFGSQPQVAIGGTTAVGLDFQNRDLGLGLHALLNSTSQALNSDSVNAFIEKCNPK